MANREDEFDLDFGEFDDFDFGDPFSDGDVPKKDRNPSTEFVGGFLQGVQDTAKRPSTYVDFMRKALPEGYSAAYGVAEDVTGKGLGLYNEVVTDLRPAMRDLKRLMYRAKNAVDSVLPDSLSKKLDGWLKDKEQESRSDQNYDPNELKIATDLAEIFKVQAEAKAEDDKKGLLEQAVESKRHRTQTEQLDEVRMSLKQLTGYQDTVTYAYQKKSLELQYRQYFSQRDLLEVTKASTQESVSLLRNIQKNTGLPDIQKTFDSELATRLTKERLFGAVQERIAPFAREFLTPFFSNIGKRIKEKTSEFTDVVNMVAMGVDQVADTADMMEDMGESKSKMAGREIGSGATGWLARWLGKQIRPYVEKNPNIMAGNYKAGYYAENYDLILKEYIENATPNNPILQMLQESAADALRVRQGTKVGYDDISRATERVVWDNLSRKSLVEIIPGFLARILQSSEGIRTGQMPSLITYDNKTNRFITVKQMANNIREQAIDKFSLERISNRTNEVIDKMDPTKSMSPELRSKLQMFLVKQAQANKGFSSTELTDDYELMRAGFNGQEAEQISEIIRTTLETDFDGKVANTPEAQKARRDIARDMRSLRELIPSVYEFANINANTGNREAMRQAGITRDVNGEDHVDTQFLIRKMSSFLKGEFNEDAASEVFADSSGLPTVNGSRGRTNFIGDNSAAIMEAIKASQFATQEILREFKTSTNRTSPEFDTRSEFDRLIAAMKEESTKEQAISASETLREILEIVDALKREGVPTVSMGEIDSEDGRKWKRLSKIGRGIKGIGNAAMTPLKGLWSLGGAYAKGVGSVISNSYRTARNFGGALFEPIRDRLQDIYVPGEIEPRIKAALMQAGEYIDEKTGKAIKSIKDIKGTVLDKAGNVILDVKDIKKGLLTRDGKPIGTKLVGGMVDMGLKAMGWMKDQLGKGFALPFSITAKAFSSLKKTLSRTPDVYVLGEAVPRLKGSLLRAGHYISAKTRRPIFSVEDIDGDVLDSTTGELVLSAVDAAKGLVDRWGKPIRNLMGKLTDLARKGYNVGMGALKWGGKQLMEGFGMVKDVFTKGLKGVKGMFGGVHIGGVKMDPVVTSVDRIYDLLVKYFASKGMSEADIEQQGIFDPQSGDVELPNKPSGEKSKSISERIKDKAEALKNRAGSWWNRRQKGDEKPLTKKEKAVKEAKEKSGGWLGTILTALSGVAGGVVSAIKWLGSVLIARSAAGAVGDIADIGDLGGDAPDKKGKKGKGGKGGRGPGGKGKGGLLRKLAVGGARLGWGALKFAGRAALFAGLGALKVGGAIASVVSAPVVLGAAAVAAVGYAGYKAYRYFKDRLKPLQRLRFSQYGLPLDNLEKCAIVGQMEMDLKDSIVWSDGKAINISSRFDFESLLERFGIEKTDKNAVESFATWFQYRFKPVYLTHVSVLSKLSPGTKLEEADDMPDYLKVTYAKATRYSPDAKEQPYSIVASPFPDVPLVRGRDVIDDEVRAVIEDNKNAIRPNKDASKVAASKNPEREKTGRELDREYESRKRKERWGLDANGRRVNNDGRTDFVSAPVGNEGMRPGAPVGSKVNPFSPSSPTSIADANRTNFVSDITASETAAELANRNRDKRNDEPQTGLYASIPSPTGNGSWDAVKGTLMAVAAALGIDVRKLATLARLESSFNINAKAKTSSAKGLFQFIASTWRGMMDKFGSTYGIPKDAQPTDPKAAAIMAAQFLKQNEDQLKGALGRTPDLTESYLAHFLGAGGSKTFLKADRTALAADVLPEAARANKSIFYHSDGSPRTVEEVIQLMRNKVERASDLTTHTAVVVNKNGDISNLANPGNPAAAEVVEQGPRGIDDGRANRSALLMKTKPILTQALPTSQPLPAGTTTAYSLPPPSKNQETVDEMDRKQQVANEVRKRQIEQQQIAVAQTQREDLGEAVKLARDSLTIQRSMDASLQLVVQHLRNLETLAKAEKPEVKTEKVAEIKTSGPNKSLPPVAKLSMTRKTL